MRGFRARAGGDRVRRAAPAQRRQGGHHAQADRHRRANPCPGREPCAGDKAGPRDHQGADLYRARGFENGTIVECGGRNAECGRPKGGSSKCQRSTFNLLRSQSPTLNSQPSPPFVLSAPMPVIEREETRARTELGAAQKDMARELGAKLSSLKGIVWAGVGLLVFGLAAPAYS